MANSNAKRLVTRVDDDLYDAFSLCCAMRKETMQAVLKRLALGYVNETKELKNQGLLKLL